MLKIHRRKFHATASGFSIIELAIVLAIVSTLLGGLLLSLSEVRESNNRTDANSTMDEIKEALYGFAQSNGRLPCPATTTSLGAEAPVGGGVCTQRYGFLPWTTLGLSGPTNVDNLMMDSWLSPYRYNVSNIGASAFTTAGQMRTLGIAALAPNLQICTVAACGVGNVLVNSAPAVVVSLGANFATFTSADERANSGETTRNGYRQANNNNFVFSVYNEATFDDMITWLSPSILYTRMIAAGQLP
ncbi:MAG: prepilin-type cleavage/methylation domain-containing protein [SAR86 cluster bacterium]|uniref:Prepilin-type cleavage/methylation domain-containing protein n=1 Tax=SAR86 cluster bacterium TaxID=2030880 RepID=A0A2A4XIU2_9GAMM|nr:MAG: prepilin-type cleavage/methylation domain-containing protein [SAR86 cluster bacterium]